MPLYDGWIFVSRVTVCAYHRFKAAYGIDTGWFFLTPKTIIRVIRGDVLVFKYCIYFCMGVYRIFSLYCCIVSGSICAHLKLPYVLYLFDVYYFLFLLQSVVTSSSYITNFAHIGAHWKTPMLLRTYCPEVPLRFPQKRAPARPRAIYLITGGDIPCLYKTRHTRLRFIPPRASDTSSRIPQCALFY